jgi:hypothetical protein
MASFLLRCAGLPSKEIAASLDISNHAGHWGSASEPREGSVPQGSLHLVVIGIAITIGVAMLSGAMVAEVRLAPIATEAPSHGTVAPASIPASTIDPVIGVTPLAPSRALPTVQPNPTSAPSEATSAPVIPVPAQVPQLRATRAPVIAPTQAVPTQAVPTQSVPTQPVPTLPAPTAPALPTLGLPTPIPSLPPLR